MARTRESTRPRLTHGGYVGGREAPEHRTWRSMLARCTNPRNASFSYYGGKGVTVCDRWWDYGAFAADVGPRPGPDYSLDRIDNTKGYEPGNVRWATRSCQQKNKSSTRRYSDGQFTGTLVECAAKVGISKELASWRWKHQGTFMKGTTWHELPKAP